MTINITVLKRTKHRLVRAFTAIVLICHYWLQLNSVHITTNTGSRGHNLYYRPEPEHLLVTFEGEGSLPWTITNAIPQTSSAEFMRKLVELKRRRNITLPWEGTAETKLPTPIFVLSLPKSGTTAVHQYLTCGNISVSHTYTKVTTPSGGKIRIADCLRDNYLKDQQDNSTPPLSGCDGYAALTDIGHAGTDPGQCYYSSLHENGLEYISKYYPNATIVLITRDPQSWYQSIKVWHDGITIRKLKNMCGFPGYLVDGSDMERWMYFYKAHTQKVRDFAMSNLGLTYIESELENGHMIGQYTGIESECWMDCKPHGHGGCTSVNKTSAE